MISGTVVDEFGEPAMAIAVQLINSAGDQIKGISTNIDGSFAIDAEPGPKDTIIISSMGYENQEFNANNVPSTIQLKPSAEMLPDADVTSNTNKKGKACSYLRGGDANDDTGTYAKTSVGTMPCKPTCKFDSYTATEKHEYDLEVRQEVYFWDCVLDPKKDRKTNKDSCTSQELQNQNLEHVKSAFVQEWDEKTGIASKCIITKCENDDYTLDESVNKCVSNEGKSCTPSNDANVTNATWQNNGGRKLACLINACSDELVPNTDKTACVRPEAIRQAEENLRKAKANENSLVNKATSAATMATTGIGGMMLASGIAEQRADTAAENDMRTYLESFSCDYGAGLAAKGGDTNVEMPGGNELFDLYRQYATLAADLKARKESLGLRPGIESEVVTDKNTTGLYDDVGIGTASGGYASVARAIENWAGEDAQQLRAQSDKTATKMEIGTGAATVGVMGSIVLNNHNNSKK